MPHVLIIDDQQSNIEALGALLTREGVSSDSVMSARQLGSITHQNYDAVFLDLEFPNDNGFTLLGEVRGKFPGAPVIAYSVHTSEMEAAREVGFDGFLGKPLSVRDFPEHIRQILNREPVWYLP